jgi:hypothetical protein
MIDLTQRKIMEQKLAKVAKSGRVGMENISGGSSVSIPFGFPENRL